MRGNAEVKYVNLRRSPDPTKSIGRLNTHAFVVGLITYNHKRKDSTVTADGTGTVQMLLVGSELLKLTTSSSVFCASFSAVLSVFEKNG